MNDKRFEKLLRQTADEYNQPPETPVDSMWSELQRKRTAAVDKAVSGRRGTPTWWRRSSVIWPSVAAAVLLVGIGIGRWSVAPEPTPDVAAVNDVAPSADPTTDGTYYRLAAARHLQQTETLITLFTLEDGDAPSEGRQKRIDDWAKRLLSDTRLLLDSPAGEDTALHKLLTELEFVLARIVYVSNPELDSEQQRLTHKLREDALLMRLRSQLPAGRV